MMEALINDTAQRWDDLTYAVLDLKAIPTMQLRALLKDSYEILYFYHRQNCAPKAVSKLLLEMEELLYFASLMEDGEVEKDFYHYQAMHCIVKALQEGYFRGEYACPFPVLKFLDPTQEERVVDLENGKLEEAFG